MIELRLGLSEPVLPDDMPAEGCLDADGNRDGGSEWHLLADGKPERRLLAFCNDGYGASGVGDDEIMVSDNHLTHIRSGGSAWRWVETHNYQLSPALVTGIDSCNYSNIEAWTGTRLSIDTATAGVTVLGYRAGGDGDNEAGIGCPTESDALPIAEKMRFLKALAVPVPAIAGPVPADAGIGTCGVAISADGSAGTVIHGIAAAPGRGAELRAVALDGRSLLIDVRDPLAGSGGQGAKSWVGQPHVELYLKGAEDSPKPFAQLGITLDGQVHAGVGKAAVPVVAVSRGIDEKNRDVTRLRLRFAAEDALAGGLVIVYSEAEKGRQLRLTSTAPVERLTPLLAPAPTAVPTTCAIADGRLTVSGLD
ncbi:hypothetical protein [Zavarzinia compransoris]|uniref:Uncharacterized protein n=1 Tax=Zavarzinia compransoris TaxID=1264899 RepID=A0A317E194_9PROT|nr:hypothetical protein [Zavarzinia compransoris]PWR19900.1 hypothetical protein DKG75_15725 [Zavarzinia compransoris]TDP44986.1 hypothetical protein DES42_106207 [Zavarzinia compransoris]